MRGILTYHSIDPSGSPVSVHPDAFARHVRWLASGEVPVVPLAGITSPDCPATALAITFDDAFANFGDVAWPLLRDAGLPVTVFAVSGRLGKDNVWSGAEPDGVPPLPLMDAEALARVAEEGAEVGGHSRTHPRFAGLDTARLEDEVAGCRDDLATLLGAPPRAFCYPYGDHDGAARAAVRTHFERACTTELRLLGDDEDPFRLPRLDAYYLQAPGRLEGFPGGAFRAYLGVRAALRGVRSRLLGDGARVADGGAGQGAEAGMPMSTMGRTGRS